MPRQTPERGMFALALDSSNTSGLQGEVVRGALSWARTQRLPQWVQVFSAATKAQQFSLGSLGVVTAIYSEETAQAWREKNFPVINVSNSRGITEGLGNILSDDLAIGRMAGAHLLNRGYREFLGFCVGDPVPNYGFERCEGFRREVEAHGGHVQIVYIDINFPTARWLDYPERMEEVVRPHLDPLPMDAGIFAINDWLAVLVQLTLEDFFPQRAHTTGVIGVDNSLGWGHAGPLPGLSSIQPGFFEIGCVALEWLSQHPGPEGKEEAARLSLRQPPLRLVERASTAGAACADPMTARIARWAWEQVRLEHPLSVEEMARHHGMSRRSLDRRFSEHVGKPAGEFLHALRLNYARQLITESNIPFSEVSYRTGFSKQSALSRAIRVAEGCTPRELRLHAGKKPREVGSLR